MNAIIIRLSGDTMQAFSMFIDPSQDQIALNPSVYQGKASQLQTFAVPPTMIKEVLFMDESGALITYRDTGLNYSPIELVGLLQALMLDKITNSGMI